MGALTVFVLALTVSSRAASGLQRNSRSVYLVRHGESTFNFLNRFCGWTDVPLTPKGEAEAIAAARFIRGFDDNKVDVDVVFTSRLQRACLTATLLSDSLGINPEAIVQDWRLNEQMYGALTGLNKREAMAQFGHAQVQRWRRGWNEAPPAVLTGPEWTFKAEPKCSGLKENCDIDEQEYEKLNGGTESFAALGVRVQSFWTEKVAPELTAGKKVMIVAHGNALRSIIQRLDGLSHAEVREIVVPRCTPLEYRFTMVDGFVEVAPFPTSEAAKGLSARFLSSPDEVVKRLQEERSYIDVERISGGGL